MSNDLFFDGDPENDSTRRHMERVLNAPRPSTVKKAAFAGAAVWGIWRLVRAVATRKWTDGGMTRRPH